MHEPSRRTVFSAGLGLVGLMVVGVDAPGADAATAPAAVRRDYASSVGKVFTARHHGRIHRLMLTAVQDLPHTSAADRQYCFSLLFTPAGRAVLHDGIYTVQRAGVPTHSLFLGRVGTGRTLQAVVNRAY
ncbi:MAG TPA: hypothetical protein VE441_12095 [Mycobacterium sp.]|jgi:hypothetical protein|nr:hypothetical protein [Mycobacterium sp.]